MLHDSVASTSILAVPATQSNRQIGEEMNSWFISRIDHISGQTI